MVNVYPQNTTNQASTNSFNLHIHPYYTLTNASIDYFSIYININSHNNSTLLLKPLHSYSFTINNNLVYKINNNIYKPSYIENNTEKYFKLTIVNFNDTKTLYSSDDNTLNINFPTNIDNKVYIKIKCKLININNQNDELKSGYYNRDNIFVNEDYFIHYVPIHIDLKSVIRNKINYNNIDYFVHNFKNKIIHYNNYTYLYDITTLDSNSSVNFSIINKTTQSNELNSSYYSKNNNQFYYIHIIIII